MIRLRVRPNYENPTTMGIMKEDGVMTGGLIDSVAVRKRDRLTSHPL